MKTCFSRIVTYGLNDRMTADKSSKGMKKKIEKYR